MSTGFVKSLFEGKFEEQEAKRFQRLQVDLCIAVSNLKTALNGCHSTLFLIRSEAGEESKAISTLQEKIQAFEEEIDNPLIGMLTTARSFQDLLSDTLQKQLELKTLIDREAQTVRAAVDDPNPNYWPERLTREKEREKDLQAATILFEGEDGIRRLTSKIAQVGETMAEAKNLREDLNYILAKLRREPLDELEELDELGDRMNQLAKWL